MSKLSRKLRKLLNIFLDFGVSPHEHKWELGSGSGHCTYLNCKAVKGKHER